MTATELKAYRERAGLSQAELANAMGLSLRPYQALEAGEAAITARHVRALEAASLRLALAAGNPTLALERIARDALDYAEMVATVESRPATVRVYGFKRWDIHKDGYVESLFKGTAAAIAAANGVKNIQTAEDVPADQVDGNGFYRP